MSNTITKGEAEQLEALYKADQKAKNKITFNHPTTTLFRPSGGSQESAIGYLKRKLLIQK